MNELLRYARYQNSTFFSADNIDSMTDRVNNKPRKERNYRLT